MLKMTKKEKLVYLTSQTFHDAGGVDNFGKLKMLGEICYSNEDSKNGKYVNQVFTDEARELGADYVFNIHYEEGNSLSDPIYLGTAYRKMSFLEKLFSSKI